MARILRHRKVKSAQRKQAASFGRALTAVLLSLVMCTMGISPSALASMSASSSSSASSSTSASSSAPASTSASSQTPAADDGSTSTLSEQPQQSTSQTAPATQTIEQTITTAAGIHYTVTMTYGAEAHIPDGATLKLAELIQTPEDYSANSDAYRDRPYDFEQFVGAADLAARNTKLADAFNVHVDQGDHVFLTKYLDITIQNGQDAVQPSAPVQLVIETDAIERNQSNAIEIAVDADTTTSQFSQIGYQSVAVSNETKPAADPQNETTEEQQKRVRLSFTTDLVGEIGLAGIATPRVSWQTANTDISILGPRSANVSMNRVDVNALPSNMELVGSLSPTVNGGPDYGTALWLSTKPQENALQQSGVYDGFTVYQLQNATLGPAISSTSNTAPVPISLGAEYAFVHERGYLDTTLNLGDVVVDGSMPVNTFGTASDVTSEFSDIGALSANVQNSSILGNTAKTDAGTQSDTDENRLTAIAAYDISLEANDGTQYQPSVEHPVEVTITNKDIPANGNFEIWHVQDDGTVDVITDFTIRGDRVTFTATGLSVYVIVGSGSDVAHRCTFTFYVWNDVAGTYSEYFFTDDEGKSVSSQAVKSTDELVIPQLASKGDEVFVGWYEGSMTGGTLILADKPYDFDNASWNDDTAVFLYAVYKKSATITFHDQYDSSSSNFPIAYTRREALNSDATPSATIKISDLSTMYTGTDDTNMAFRGWSFTPITTPGAAIDDSGNPVDIITPDAEGCITVTEDTDLYPVYENIYWLTYYAAESGLSASYVAPAYYFAGNAIDLPLPTTSRDGYTFEGWWTGELNANEASGVAYTTQITDGSGNLVASAASGGDIYSKNNQLYLRADVTLYAKWTASYDVVTWKQKTSDADNLGDDAKTYEYVETFTYAGVDIGATVELPNEFKAAGKYPGYTYNSSKSQASAYVGNTKAITTLNVYYDRDGSFTPGTDTHTLIFADSVTGEGASPMPSAVGGLTYGTSLSDYAPTKDPISVRKSATGKDIYDFSGWYADRQCTIPVFFQTPTADDLESLKVMVYNETTKKDEWNGEYKPYVVYDKMPYHDVTVYAGWAGKKFRVDIDPNYGALYYYDSNDVLQGSGSTYFNNTYVDEPIGEYKHTTRDYVESSSGTYFYVNHDRAYGGADRKTYYTTRMAVATEDTTFEYAPGTYAYAGWYEVYRDESGKEIGEASEPYDFSQHTDHNTKLRLHWKKAGTYYLGFNAGAGMLEDGTSKDMVSAEGYADYSETTLTCSAIAPSGYTFIGWRVHDSNDTRTYTSGQTFTLHADDAVRSGGKEIVYFDAVYAKVGTASIVYDANGGTFDTTSTIDYGSIPSATGGNPTAATGVISSDAKTATVSGLVNNSKFTLSSGTGLSYSSGGVTYTLAGWSNKREYNPNDEDAELYALGGTFGVDKQPPSTLYAVWTTTVAYNLNSPDADWGSTTWDSPPYTYNSENNTYSQDVYLGNAVDEPVNIPVYSGQVFRYWTTLTDGPSEYDFTQKVTRPLDLYAYWSAPIEVPVHAVDASTTDLKEKTSADSGWGISNVLATGAEITFNSTTAASYVSTPDNYDFAFVALHDTRKNVGTISQDEAITSIKYDSTQKRVCVKYADATDYVALPSYHQLYFVYYQTKTLNIDYRSMAISGELSTVEVTGAPTTTGTTLLGTYDMASSLETPLSWQTGNSYYSFAVGEAGATDASALHQLTAASNSNSSRPALQVRNTWRGFEYSEDGSTWTNCGYSPHLYVIYYTMQPTIIMFQEQTVSTSALIDAEFTYDVRVTQNAGGTESVLFDTTKAGTNPYKLKTGEEQSAILFHDSNLTQTITITQREDSRFSTSVNSDSGTADQDARSWTYTSSGATAKQTVSFANTQATLPVEVHVVQVESDGIVLRDNSRSSNAANYSFNIALGSNEVLLNKLSSSDVYVGADPGDKDKYAFGAIVKGTGSTEGSSINADTIGITSIAYKQIDGNVCGLVVTDSEGNTSELGNEELYYLYYPMPRIQYMKEGANGALSSISGSIINPQTAQPESDTAITYDHETVTMNDAEVEQKQGLQIPLGGLTISQTGNNFRMPSILDDDIYPRYLGYAKIGAGAADAENISAISTSDDLIMYMRIQDNALQYSFDGTHWTDLALASTPTVYAIYSERGYDLQINKSIDLSQSGNEPLFADKTFPITIRSTAITQSSYGVEGYDADTITATPASGSTPGSISFTVGDGTQVKIKGLAMGDYTVTEQDNDNYTLTAKQGPIVGGSLDTVNVADNSTVSFRFNSEAKVELTNTPRAICRIVDGSTTTYFYSIQSAVLYAGEHSSTSSADIEMLVNYVMPKGDTVTIPNGYNITITTAEEGVGGTEPLSTITRSNDLADVPLFTNNGNLTFKNITLDGNSVAASQPIIQSAGNLTVGASATVKDAVNSGNGGAINASAGSVTVSSGSITGCSSPEGGAIYHSGNGVITIDGTAALQNNTATSGNGGGIYAESGTIGVAGTALISGNKAENGFGGAIYGGNVKITVGEASGISNNRAKAGGAIYADQGIIEILRTPNVTPPSITNNTATASNGGAIYVGEGSIEVSGGSLTGNTAVNGKGGAIYANGANVTLSNSAVVGTSSSANSAAMGGAIYAENGTVHVSASSVAGNSATAGGGGAIYAGGGAVTISDSSIEGNTAAANGGAVYAGTGNVVLSDSAELLGNTSTAGNGGAVFAQSGSVTVTQSTLGGPNSGDGNTASSGSGGAIYAGSGIVSLTDVDALGNTAGSNGGAVYAGSGSVTFYECTVTGNTAAENGGAAYAQSGAVTVSQSTFGGASSGDGNTATTGSGGGLYAGSGSVTLTDSAIFTGNAANAGNGGAVYAGSGAVSLASTTEMTQNTAANGSAIFINTGSATFVGGTYTGNSASGSGGGAVGMGSATTRLYFSGDVQVKDNTLSDGTTKSNIYLNQDSKDVLNIAGLGNAASLGIYVSNSQTTKRDVPGARFATYTSDDHVTSAISNDRHSFGVQKDESAKQLFWGVSIGVEVRYQSSFQTLPPTGSYETKYSNNAYYPETSSSAVSELANQLRNDSSIDLHLTSSSVYATAFASDASGYSDYITNFAWNSSEATWEITKRDGTTESLGNRKIFIYYSEPAYIAIENNTDLPLDIETLTVAGRSVVNSSDVAGYGLVYAKNGSVRTALLPVTADDLTLDANESINLLIPGGQSMTYELDGKFTTSTGVETRLRRTGHQEETLTPAQTKDGFILADPLLGTTDTYQIIFGDDRYICKVVDAAGVEHRYTTISGAIADIVSTTSADPPYTLAAPKTATIQMLVDYLLPSSDDVAIPDGYDITLTTAEQTFNGVEQTHYYHPANADEPRATISRDTGNENAMIRTAKGSNDAHSDTTALTITDLIFDVKGVQGSTPYGAVMTYHCSVTVDNAYFKNLYAHNGGAIYATVGLSSTNSFVTVTNSQFYNCHSILSGGRNGGGAVHANAAKLTVQDSTFDSCDAVWQAGAVFHQVDSSGPASESLIERCEFTNCRSQAAGGLELDAKTIVVNDCSFTNCVANQRNGGAFNIYVANEALPGFDCSAVVTGCEFVDCRLTDEIAYSSQSKGNGGGFRSNSLRTIVSDCTFTNNSAYKFGGAISVSNTKATYARIYGTNIEQCTAYDQGGGIYSTALETTIADFVSITTSKTDGIAESEYLYSKRDAEDTSKIVYVFENLQQAQNFKANHGLEEDIDTRSSEIKNCSARNEGGGIFQTRNASGSSLSVENASVIGNESQTNSKPGGGIFTNAWEVAVKGSIITNNVSKGDGGGIYVNGQTSLTLTDSTISNNTTTNGNGGGVWFDYNNNTVRQNLVLEVNGCTIDGNRSSRTGGGIYTSAGTVTVGKYDYPEIKAASSVSAAGSYITDDSGNVIGRRTSISNCTAAASAGGIYHNFNAEGSKLEIKDGSKINENAANGGTGGGVYANVRKLDVTDSEISKNKASSNGGGIWFYNNTDTARDNMTLLLLDCTMDGNSSGDSGGAIYTDVKTVEIKDGSDIANCTAAKTGGGVCHSTNRTGYSLTVENSTIRGCAANGGNGGGVYVYVPDATFIGSSVTGNTASGSGGGIYKEGDNSGYYLVLDDTDVIANRSGNQGGGIYCKSQLQILNGTEVSSNRLTSSTVDNAAGVYLVNNRTLYVGPEFPDTPEGRADAAAFTDSSTISGNYTASGADSNLRLWYTNGQNNVSSVYVYCNLSGKIGVTNAAKVGTQFGTSLIPNPNGFTDDNAMFQADTSTLHGIIDRMDESGTKIVWAGPPIAKICGKDADGNDILLYLKNNGTGPAVFDKLNAGNNGNYGTTSAFGILNTQNPPLYKADGTLYTGNTYSIKMLVQQYTSDTYLHMRNYSAGRTVIFTTASPNDTDSYPGPTSGRSTVMRGTGTGNTNFLYVDTGVTLTLTNIIIDGGSENGVSAQGNTRNLYLKSGSPVVTLGEGAFLQNARTSGHGGGVYIDSGALAINGGRIRNCGTTGNTDGGGVYVNGGRLELSAGAIEQCSAGASGGGVRVKEGSFSMSGGSISSCSAVSGGGGGVYLGGGKIMYMSGGSVINNSAKTKGGGVAFYDKNSRLYLWQRVNISGNTCTASVATDKACNVELDQDSNEVIQTYDRGLYPGSYVGVYVPNSSNLYNKHGQERMPFGTFASDDDATKLYSFVNDRNGLKGGKIDELSPNTIYWKQVFSLEVSKEVLASDSNPVPEDEEFSFTVILRGDATDSGQPDAEGIDSSDGSYGEMDFTSNGVNATTATFTLKAGESVTATNLSQGLTYEVIENLTDAQKTKYATLSEIGADDKIVLSGTIGENKTSTTQNPYTSIAKMVNVLPICKATKPDGSLLYVEYTYSENMTPKTFYVPAVYTELTGDSGAFAALQSTAYYDSRSGETIYNAHDGAQIQMLVNSYAQTQPIELPRAFNGVVTLTTAAVDDSSLPYQGPGTTSTIRRSGFADASMYTVNGKLTLSNIILDGAKNSYTVGVNGGIVNVPNGGQLTIQRDAVLQNSRVADGLNGGALYVASGGNVTMTGGTIRLNAVSSTGNGAGVYLSEGSMLNLSGTPNFGGTGVDVGGNIYTASDTAGRGNFKDGNLIAQNNGGKSYRQARQDIYIAGYQGEDDATNAASLNVNGDIVSGDGTIWVWAAEAPHYKSLQQFATMDNSVADAVRTSFAFRNARYDSETENETNSYLHGIRKNGEGGPLIYWYGVEGGQTVMLRKVNESNESVVGAVFDVLQSNASTVVSVDGVALSGLSSSSTGIIWVGVLPYGTYYLHETSVPSGYRGFNSDGTNWYRVEVTEDGVTMSGPMANPS